MILRDQSAAGAGGVNEEMRSLSEEGGGGAGVSCDGSPGSIREVLAVHFNDVVASELDHLLTEDRLTDLVPLECEDLSFLRLLPCGSFQQSLRVSLVQKSRHVRRLVSRGCACIYTDGARRKGVESYGRQAGGAILEDDLSPMEHPIGEETRPSREGQEVLDDAVHDDGPLGRLHHVVLLGRGRVSRLLLARLFRRDGFDIPSLELKTLQDRLHVCLSDVHSDVPREANLLCIRCRLPLLSFLR
mmetsp:Transcript_21048/g.70158  ORF Transcript_21048/g.70158 Transcript_21048/m.70158 type:complete len:244 (+) Transcript_21048:422-1153(+)